MIELQPTKLTEPVMKRLALFIFLFVLTFFQKSFSQTCPPNIDFESGDFSSWECFTGTTVARNGLNEINLTLSGPVPGRHEIISAASGNQLDPYGNFPMLCPYGGNYSVKLGNNQSSGQAEGLSYTFNVPTTIDTFTFTYFYAVVFEDPGHSAIEQPRFFVTAYDVATGNLINCASFNYIANGAIPGFKKSTVKSDVLYKEWSPASLQFAGLGGRTVRLEFKTADCTLGAHFGYAYVDVGSGCSNIMATAPYCRETNSLILNAPYGFKTYTWYNEDYTKVIGNQQSLTLSPPPDTNGIFHVDVIPYPGYGCRDTLQAIVKPLPVPDTPAAKSDYTYCQFQNAPALTATPTRGYDLFWYTTEFGGIGTKDAPIPSTTKPGTFTYYVSQKVLFGCESIRRKITVNIISTPVASFTINTIRQCQNGNQYVFTSTSTNKSNSMYSWDFGNGANLSSATDSIVNYNYTTAGNFTVKLKVTNSGACSTEKPLVVTVIPKPVATFTYPPIVCEKQTPVTINNTSSVPGGVAAINKWWWNVAGAITQAQNLATFTPVSAGPLPVKLVVTTTEGCSSDTNNTVLNVHYRPTASLKYNTPLCNNETVQFTDLSKVSSGTSTEAIVKWYWQFDNNTNTATQHPATNFTSGQHYAKLITESNFGCKSIETDSMFTINAKPQIQLSINDSCVFRTIRYQAVDMLNTVNKWYWNFGNGFYNDASLISQSYSVEGYKPLTLIAQTAHGCKDTIIRPFTVYDNKALAGRDTLVAINQQVQLNAHGGANVQYVWSPALGLDNSSIENPVATLEKDQLYRLDAVTDKGCDSHSKILIKRYVGPEIYIPSAFTPNGDGLNEVLKVFPVGIKSFNFFAVYDRAGQQVFYTTNFHDGWDGTFKGIQLQSGTYVAYATAIDYKGLLLSKKISVTIIR